MAIVLNLTGVRSGRLTAIEPTAKRARDGGVIWRCRCDCGRDHYVKAAYLKAGKVLSCGCLPRDLCREIGEDGELRQTHGGSNTRLYRIWSNMKSRCYNPKNNNFPNYGGRGIKICGEWFHDFGKFQTWAYSHGYRDDLSIDRIDVNGNYCPDNCRWATQAEQSINKRPRIQKRYPQYYPKYAIDGELRTAAEWAEIAGIKHATFLSRWRKGDRGRDLIRSTSPREITQGRNYKT